LQTVGIGKRLSGGPDPAKKRCLPGTAEQNKRKI
jgi:hypothetical protein